MKANKQTRNTETKKHIKQALQQLLQEKSFEEISVTMICREAGINRGTFYLHYLDKYDMMDKLKEETLSYIYNIITKNPTEFSKEVIYDALAYLYQDFQFISVLAKTTYVNMPKSIRQFIASILSNIPDFEVLVSQHYGGIPSKYAKAAYIASIEAIILRWIGDGGQESPGEMAEIIYQVYARKIE